MLLTNEAEREYVARSANTNAASMMTGWRAADFVLGSAPAPASAALSSASVS